jgi:hypothetical protein
LQFVKHCRITRANATTEASNLRPGTNHANAQRFSWLLRVPCPWPADRSAADQRDEIASSKLIEMHSVSLSSQGRIAQHTRIGLGSVSENAKYSATGKPVALHTRGSPVGVKVGHSAMSA